MKTSKVRSVKYLVCIFGVALLVVGWRPAVERVRCRLHQPDYLLDAISRIEYWKIRLYVNSGCEVNKLQANDEGAPYYISASQDRYDVEEIDRFALADAARYAHPEIVKYLLQNGANPNYATRSGSTALHFVCKTGVSVPTIQLLLDSGANVNSTNQCGLTPLDNLGIDRFDAIGCLLDRGALLGAKKMTVNEARNMQAALPGALGGIPAPKPVDRRVFLSKQQTLDELLCRAASEGAYQTASMLMDRGANPNAAQGVTGLAPLLLCAKAGVRNSYSSSIDLLRKKNRDRASMASLLLKHGAKVLLAKTKAGQTALHFACQLHDAKLAETLLKAGADPNAKDKEGKTPYAFLTPVEELVR